MFTLLPKKGALSAHRDPYAGSLRYHLGLITPNSEECYISVDGKHYFWEDGKDILFDETYIHYAKNNTEFDRIILFCDVQRPLTNVVANKFNQLFNFTVMKAVASKNLPYEQVGPINKIFKYYYQIRLVGKRLKGYNRTLYYIVNYAIYLCLAGYFLFL